MKDIDTKYKELEEELGITDKEEQRKVLKRASISIIIVVLLLVTAISFIVYIFEQNFGKTAGTAALIVVAAIIAGYLYRDEIKSKFKRK